MKLPLYSILTVTHDALPLVKRYFDAHLKNTPLDEVEIIVSDNASREPVVEYIRALAEGGLPVRVIAHPVGLGYLRAQNLALPLARGEWLVLLNPSTSVPPGWLAAMRSQLEKNPKLGICGVEGTCWSLTPECMGHPGPIREYVETSCAMMRTELVMKMSPGLYDEGFRMGYCEDVDLSFRLRDRGYELAWADIDVQYIRGTQWAKSEREEGIDVTGFLAYNQKRMIQKWSRYFERRNFKETVLIKRKGAAGDVLLTTPVIHEIKRLHAHWEIDVETSFPQVFDRNPEVRKAFTTSDTRHPTPVSYDHVFDLNDAYENRPRRNFVDAYAEVCRLAADQGGVQVRDRRPRIYPSPEDRAWASKAVPVGDFSVLHTNNPASPMPGRTWPADLLDKLARLLQARGMKIVLVGRSADNPLVTCDIDLRGPATLHQMAAVIERAKLLVGVDSLPAHLARAFGIPTVIVSGSVDPRLSHGDYPNFRYVRDETLGCLGCHHVFPVPNHGSGCLRPRVFCMERVTPEMVLKAVDEVLSHREAGA